jgi:hypothetical protein
LFGFVCLFVCLFVFQDRVSLFSPGCPGTLSLSVDQAGLELRDTPASAGIKGVSHHSLVFELIFILKCILVPFPFSFLFFCETLFPLNVLQDVQDPSVFVTFPLEEDENTSLVAWTTTPWTLPSNLALCVNPEIQYVKIKGLLSS